MLTASEKARLERIEQKIDRLLLLLSPSLPADDSMHMKAAVYASGGVKALQQFCKAEAEKKANASRTNQDDGNA